MKVITEIRVERRTFTRYGLGAQRGSGYCLDQYQRQFLVKRWKWCGITIWKRTLDSEDVPSYAWIDHATLGFTTWQSKFSEYIK